MRLRRMTAEDAPTVSVLSEQLCYQTTAERIRARLAPITRNPDNAFTVAEHGGAVVGWVPIGVLHGAVNLEHQAG